MATGNRYTIRLHEDQELFRESVSFTAAETTFPPRLVEKDYFCIVLLEYFNGTEGLAFKGETCLAKVHANFYRLSEDLDFVIPMPVDSERSERRKAIDPVKTAFKTLTRKLPIFREKETLKGANNSTQYVAVLEYDSPTASQPETIKVEISLHELLLESAKTHDARDAAEKWCHEDLPAACLPVGRAGRHEVTKFHKR